MLICCHFVPRALAPTPALTPLPLKGPTEPLPRPLRRRHLVSADFRLQPRGAGTSACEQVAQPPRRVTEEHQPHRALFLGRSASNRDAGATGRLVWASPGLQPETLIPIPDTHSRCSMHLGEGRAGTARGWRGTAERLGWRQESESTQFQESNGGISARTGRVPSRSPAARPGLGSGPAARPPARPPSRRPYLAGGRPLEDCVQRGRARHRGDLEQLRQQERQEWRPDHHGVGTGAATGAVRGRERPLTRSWPCP